MSKNDTRQEATALAASELRYRRLFESAQDGILILDAETGMVVDVNPFLTNLLGYSHAEFLGKNIWELGFFKNLAANEEKFRELQARDYVRYENLPLETDAGRKIDVEFVSNVYLVEGKRVIQCNIRDISDRVRAQAEAASLTEQLRQAQKMEAMGRLAGGVAHDFNNLLMGIMGYTELCLERAGADHPMREWLDEIMHTAQRSAAITSQLLAFARKQIIAPRILDLNDTVAGMLKLVRHLIGEDITISWRPGANLYPVKIDPTQVDQMLANLCVNARDAIAGNGEITIKTTNTVFSADDCARQPKRVPGAYVVLDFSDNGCGMDKETLALVFEPFFTTKDVGKGTGLGLATVYGIITQNNGFIDVSSKPGKGTTFRIYLPQAAAVPTRAIGTTAEKPKAPRGKEETILLVEDEITLRTTCGLLLKNLGYKVMSAATPEDAMKQAVLHPEDIQLLLTDIIMPGMDGQHLAEHLLKIIPGMRVLFMSGYSADAIDSRGVLDKAENFLSKPFYSDDLARKVRAVLDAGSMDQTEDRRLKTED